MRMPPAPNAVQQSLLPAEPPPPVAAPPAAPVKAEKKKRIPLQTSDIPWGEVIDLYHAMLPDNPRVLGQGGAVGKHLTATLSARWKEHPNMPFWQEFFDRVSGSPFLTGKVAGRNGQEPFIAGLAWLVSPENFSKVIGGNYGKGTAVANATGQRSVTGHQPTQVAAASAAPADGPSMTVVAGWRMDFVEMGGTVGTAEEVAFMTNRKQEWQNG